jgi:hypothetical protein
VVVLTAVATSTSASDHSYESQSTLAPRIAPQELSIDATIASMVRRGLLADVKPMPSKPAVTVAPRPAVAAPTPAAPKVRDGWRSRGAAPSQSNQSIAPITPTPAIAPPDEPFGWQSSNAAPTPATPSHAGPSLEPPAVRVPEFTAEDLSADAGGEADDVPMAEMPVAEPEESTDAPQPLLMADRGAEPDLAEPPTSHDPLPDEHLAPIDDLPETPAPSHDAPGDAREPEIGDEQIEGALLPPANARAGADPAPAPNASSLSGQSLTPVGEPDRIERPDESVAPPSSAEQYQEAEAATPTPTRPLTRNQLALREKVRRVLKYYYANPLNTGNRSPWEVMHCMLAFEVHSRILKGGPTGDPITTVGWLCFNQPCKGRTLMYLNEDKQLRVKVGPALQGHHGQLLALLAQARVRTDYPMKVEGKDFTVADLIEEEKATCYPRTELTFKLIGLQRYLDINAKWMNDQGMQWDFPTLLREEMRQPVRTAACGGTHRLSGLILTVKKRQRSGLPVDGEYAAAQKFVANYANYAYRLQNADGSFSTEWFKGPGAEEDIDRRLKTTGHQLEFLIYASSDEQLANYRLVKAVNYLSNIMWANRGRDWEAGPLGHAIHSLVLYDRLVFAPHDGEQPAKPAPIARQQSPRQQSQRRR